MIRFYYENRPFKYPCFVTYMIRVFNDYPLAIDDVLSPYWSEGIIWNCRGNFTKSHDNSKYCQEFGHDEISHKICNLAKAWKKDVSDWRLPILTVIDFNDYTNMVGNLFVVSLYLKTESKYFIVVVITSTNGDITAMGKKAHRGVW